MKGQINLLLEKQHTKQGVRKVFLISITFFAAVLFLSLIVFFYNFSLNSQYDSLTKKEIEINTRLEVLSEKRAKLLRLQERMENIESALNTRNNLDKKILSIFTFIPDDVLIDEFSFDQKTISVSFASSFLYDFDYITEKINKSEQIREIAEVKIDSIKFDEKNSNYVMSLSFNL